jgi:hypothetical protein
MSNVQDKGHERHPSTLKENVQSDGRDSVQFLLQQGERHSASIKNLKDEVRSPVCSQEAVVGFRGGAKRRVKPFKSARLKRSGQRQHKEWV